MISVTSLWLPILLSAVLVFVASSIIHMVLGYHRTDFKKLPKEDAFIEDVRKLEIPPGDYLFPCPQNPNEMKDPAFREKMTKGPSGMMTVIPPGPIEMGRSLALWFLYCVVVEITAAYIAGRAVGPGTPYRSVFRFAGATAFFGFAFAHAQYSIWYRKSWMTTAKQTFDGLVYGLLTGGVFGWLWPR